MKFRIVGADKNTAQEVELFVDVASATAAEAYAAERGILVSEIASISTKTSGVNASPSATMHQLPKISLLSLCGALILFFLPWTDIQCSGRHVATQSGLQTIYGGVTLSDSMELIAQESKKEKNQKSEDDIGYAPIIGVALALLIVTVLISAVAAFKSRSYAGTHAVFAAVVLVLLVVQWVMGFPVNNSIRKANQNLHHTKEDRDTDFAMGAMFDIRADRTTWFYLELVLLAAPAGLLVLKQIQHHEETRHSH